MVDKWWDRVLDFAYDHGPEWLQRRMESREMDRMATEEYELHEKRVAAGFYDGHEDIYPLSAKGHDEGLAAAALGGVADAERQAREAENDRAFEAKIARQEEASKPLVRDFGVDDEDRLHRDPKEGPARVTTREEDWGHGMGSLEREEIYAIHGRLIARSETRSENHEEGNSYTEKWFDRNGELHSFNGNPSEIVRSNHYIPEESHLDESALYFHNHGISKNSIDRTYEDILAHKPIQVRNAYGIDLEGETLRTIEPAPVYPPRFPVSLLLTQERDPRREARLEAATEAQWVPTTRALVADHLNVAADARLRGDLGGARHYVERAREDRTAYLQPSIELSR